MLMILKSSTVSVILKSVCVCASSLLLLTSSQGGHLLQSCFVLLVRSISDIERLVLSMSYLCACLCVCGSPLLLLTSSQSGHLPQSLHRPIFSPRQLIVSTPRHIRAAAKGWFQTRMQKQKILSTPRHIRATATTQNRSQEYPFSPLVYVVCSVQNWGKNPFAFVFRH